MLPDIPADIIYHIVSFLPTASCVKNLSQTCRRLHELISANDYRVFQAFVQSRFASIDTPPFWVDAARALTSRSRAFERKAIIGRFVLPPQNARRIGHPRTVRTDHPTLGYRPVIDSYEVWCGSSWNDRKEVLVWGAGADLNIRVTDLSLYGKSRARDTHTGFAGRGHSVGQPYEGVTWAVFNNLHGVNSWDDISGVHALPSADGPSGIGNEDIIFGRRNGSLVRMSISPRTGRCELKKRYVTGNSNNLEKTDLSTGSQRVLAATLVRRSILFFSVDAEEDEVKPLDELKNPANEFARHHCSRLLCDDRIAVGSDGVINNISVFNLTTTGATKTREINMDGLYDSCLTTKSQVHTIEPLLVTSHTGGRAGDLFLAGWGDSQVRLHDLRSSKPYVSSFIDTVDNSPIYTIQPIGRECFLVGSGVNATVKFFDMRMANKYSYLEACRSPMQPPLQRHQHHNHQLHGKNSHNNLHQQNSLITPVDSGPKDPLTYRRRDISVFLSSRAPSHPLSRAPLLRDSLRYRGPIYTMSLPSPSSSTLYVGVEANVIRLDFASTDDITGRHRKWYEQNLGLGLDLEAAASADTSVGPGPGLGLNYPLVHDATLRPFDLSCYERPLPEDMCKGVRLMMQRPFYKAVGNGEGESDLFDEGRVWGWDQRWWQPLIKGKKKIRGRWTRDNRRTNAGMSE
ncbi:hypothetical protein GX48_03730 [Paracoccidioides brasiliensis]|nr:hypothetical protein GX48_03730 [Paracoccidioides brasiliensis]